MISAAQAVHLGQIQFLAGSNKINDHQQVIEPFQGVPSNGTKIRFVAGS